MTSVSDRAAARRVTPLRSTCARPHACSRDVRLAVLHRTPFFADLDAEEIAEVDKRAISLSWAAGDAIYTEGEQAGHLYVAAHGRAKSYRDTEDGKTVVVDLVAPGDYFGGFDSLGSPEHTETVEAIDTLCALRIAADDFRNLLVRYPQVALRVVDHLSQQLGDARTSVMHQSTRTVAERVATTLLRIADKFGEDRPGFGEDGQAGTLLQLPLTRADLAGMTGSTPESVSRVMSQLRREGIIDTGRRWTAVLDRDRLAEIAGD